MDFYCGTVSQHETIYSRAETISQIIGQSAAGGGYEEDILRTPPYIALDILLQKLLLLLSKHV